jgi:hypothetical protein
LHSAPALSSLGFEFVPLWSQWAFWRLPLWDLRQIKHETSKEIILQKLVLLLTKKDYSKLALPKHTRALNPKPSSSS